MCGGYGGMGGWKSEQARSTGAQEHRCRAPEVLGQDPGGLADSLFSVWC